MKKKFNERFSIISMSKASLLLLDNETKKEVYIHRNAFNNLDKAVEFRITNRTFSNRKTAWIEILIWKTI